VSTRAPRVLWVIAPFALLVGLYSLSYLVLGARMFPPPLAASLGQQPWALYPHVVCAGIALLVGPLQFVPRLRQRWPRAHRAIGVIYVVSCLSGALAGASLATRAQGGIGPVVAFLALAVSWFGTTALALRTALVRDIAAHRAWAALSFALTFSGVTLRLWLPLLYFVFGEFTTAYRVTAWACWVPNLVLAIAVFTPWRARARSLWRAAELAHAS
jgi:hypothetical protein